MATASPKSKGESWVNRVIDHFKSQPPAPKSPAPPSVDQTAWEQSVNSHKVNTLTVHDVGLIVFNETQSVMPNDKSNDTTSGARKKVAHAVMNGDLEFGQKRPKTAPPLEPAANAMRDSRTRAAYEASLKAAREAFPDPIDPTHGATHLNLRPSADRSNFESGGPNDPGFKIKTQSGPFDNSYPTPGKHGLPSKGIYVNTYGPE